MPEHLELSVEIGRPPLPAPADQLDRGAVRSPGAGREIAAAEGPRRAVELEGAGAHQGPRIALSEGLELREIAQESERDLPGLQVQLVLVPAREERFGPASAGLLPLAPEIL